MSVHNHHQFEGALRRLDRAILPNLSQLLDSVLESAALARPGADAEAYAAGLRAAARQMAQLTALVGAAVQRPNISA